VSVEPRSFSPKKMSPNMVNPKHMLPAPMKMILAVFDMRSSAGREKAL
jgi:hypothetical protein